MLRAGGQDVEHVLDMDHADDRIERLSIDGQAAMPGFRENLDEMVEGGPLFHRDDVGAGDTHIPGITLAEMEEIADHLPLERGQIALGIGAGIALMPIDRLFELIAQRFFLILPEDQAFQPAPYTIFVGVTVAGAATGAVGHRGVSVLAH